MRKQVPYLTCTGLSLQGKKYCTCSAFLSNYDFGSWFLVRGLHVSYVSMQGILGSNYFHQAWLSLADSGTP